MIRYPSTLFVFSIPESGLNDQGNWEASTGNWTEVCECRDTPNGSGRTVTLTDGSAYVFSSLISLPVQSTDLQPGTKIKVVDEQGNTRFQGTIARFSNERKHATIWA